MKQLAFFFFFSSALFAQQEQEEVAAVADVFQETFFESLTQKGIENYDRAITELEKCREMQPENPVVYHELGKNYQALQYFTKALEAYEKAFDLDKKNYWPLVGLYDVYYEAKNYQKAVEVVEKLITYKKEYKEELCSLYMNTGQFDKALNLINELNDEVGKSEMRENYKAQILRDPQYQGVERANLQTQIAKNPQDESNYLALMRLYSESGQDEKAIEVAKKLEKAIPSSAWAHVNLYTNHLKALNSEEALRALEIVFASRKIDNKIKHRMLNEFLIYSKDKPQLDEKLSAALQAFSSERDIEVPREVGKFFHQKKMWERALYFYSIQLQRQPDDFETKSLQLEIQAQSGMNEQMGQDAEQLIELFPLEPKYYLWAAKSNNAKKEYKKAQRLLADGLEYVVDNPALEADFLEELGIALEGLGDQKQAAEYKQQALRVKQ